MLPGKYATGSFVVCFVLIGSFLFVSFEKIQAWYNALEDPSPSDEVEYEAARMQDEARKRRVEKRRQLEMQRQRSEANGLDDQDDQDDEDEHDEQNGQNDQNDQNAQNGQNKQNRHNGLIDPADNELFVSLTEHLAQSEPGNPPPNGQDQQGGNGHTGPSAQQPKSKAPQSKRRKQNRITAAEKRKSMSYGLEAARAQAKGKPLRAKASRKRKANPPEPTEAETEGAGQPDKKKKKQKRGKAPQHDFDLDDLFSANVVTNAHESSSMSEIPKMIGKDKQKALTQLVASIPSENQAEAKSDKQIILDSSRKFTRPARSDGQGGWKIKGLLSSLHHYQVWLPFLFYTP